MRTRSKTRLGLIYFLADLLAIVAAYYTTLWIRFDSTWGEHVFTWINRTLGVRESGAVGEAFETFYVVSAPRIILILAITLCVLYALHDLYAERRFLKRRPVGWNIVVSNVLALAIFYMYFYLRRNDFHPRSMFATTLICNVIYGTLLRALMDGTLRRLRLRRGWDRHGVILVGRNRDATRIIEILERDPSRSLFLAEQLDTTPDEPISALLARIRTTTLRQGAELVILAEAGRSVADIMQFLELADQLDIAVKVLSKELDVLLTRAQVESDLVNSIPLVHFGAPSDTRPFTRFKRCTSSVAASVMLAALSPFLLLVALLIRLTSRGPVLFVQERMGVNHKPFPMYKFRTMVHRAHEALAKLESHNESGGGLFKMRNDPRVTWIGRILRRYSIDELPQLFNVLRGDMNLVGPRPLPRRDFENYYADWHYGRHNGLPGLTCLWQVSGRSDLDFHNMCILDVYYLRNQNWVLDARILMRTVWVVVFAKGAY